MNRILSFVSTILLGAVMLEGCSSSSPSEPGNTSMNTTAEGAADIKPTNLNTVVGQSTVPPAAQLESFRAAGKVDVKSTVPAKPRTTLFHNKVGILMFHDIEPKSTQNNIITPKQFKSDIDGLIARGYTFITLQQFRGFMQKKQNVPDNALLITFDDAYESFYTYAYPILKERGLSAVCFVITGELTPQGPVYTPHMTAGQIQAIIGANPDIEFQPHSDYLHSKIDRNSLLTGRIVKNGVKESQAAYLSRISADTRASIDRLKPLNAHPLDTYSYPYGLRTSVVENMLRSAGIHYAFTINPGLASAASNSYRLPRINAGSPKLSAQSLDDTLRSLSAEH